MKIRMKKLAAGPGGVFTPGSVLDIQPKEGKVLVDAGAAVEIKAPEAPQPEPEVAVAAPVETAATRKPGPANRSRKKSKK